MRVQVGQQWIAGNQSMKFNADFFKRLSTWANLVLGVIPTAIAYLPQLNGLGIPDVYLQASIGVCAVLVMLAQVVSFKSKELATKASLE